MFKKAKKSFSILITMLIYFSLFSCSRIPNKPAQSLLGKTFPTLKGNSLSKKKWTLPTDLKGKKTILLAGYVQRSQFDIDRWLIGLSMAKVKTSILEVPAVKSLFVSLFLKERLDQGMRNGILVKYGKLWLPFMAIVKN